MEFLSTIMDPEISSDKESIVDVLCRDSTGARYVIEMHLASDKGCEKRAQLYAAKAYSRQADKASKYFDLKKVFFIAISNCILFPDKLDYISSHTIRDEKLMNMTCKIFNLFSLSCQNFLIVEKNS